MPAPRQHPSNPTVVELRQYTLRGGRRDELVELFEREFVETQEAVGMDVLGQFRDALDPDRFVWLRGFADMDARERGLAAFYGGPVWAAHGTAANATMIDSDDVLLLRPIPGLPAAATHHPTHHRRPAPASAEPSSSVACVILSFDETIERCTLQRIAECVRDATAAGVHTIGCYETEPAENTFPGLPVREGEHVVVWLTRHESTFELEQHATAIDGLLSTVRDPAPISVRRLALWPTSRSLIR